VTSPWKARRDLLALSIGYVLAVLLPLALILHLLDRADPEPPRVTPHAPTSACTTRAGGDLPDPDCTPGAIDTTVGVRTVCTQPSSERRDVPPAVRRHVLVSYGMDPATFEGEVDHLVPLALGGSNDVANLWPQPGRIPNPKDRVEVRLWRAVCDGELDLTSAQRAIAADWRSAGP
jgi:hypothetical protein